MAPNTPKIKARLKAAFRTPDGSLLGQSEPFQETGQQGNSVLGYIKVQVAGNPNFALPDGSMIPVLEGHIAIGLDDNDDGTLDPTEVRTTSEALGRFVLVSKGEWDDERTFLRAGARLASRVTPNASDFLSSFANGDAQVGPGATPGQTNVRALQLSGKRLFPPLTHQVGVRFASENDGPIPLYTFATDSRISSDILKTQTIQSLVTQVWTKNQSSVQAYFANPANPDKDFTWVLLDAGGDIEFADPGRLGPLVDQDLFAAIHFAQVPVSLTLTVKAKRTSSSAYEITGHTVTGQLSDLYDFDYNAPFPAPKAAEVQAGFGTLGPQNAPDAGNVRGYVINLGGATPAVLSP